jgi:galactitol-specific phosphotransferase system IIC component
LESIIHNLFTNPFDLFNGKIFYPYSNTLSFSEFFLPLALIAIPIFAICENPVLAYNCIFLGGIALAGFFGVLLAYSLTGNCFASIFAGAVMMLPVLRFH